MKNSTATKIRHDVGAIRKHRETRSGVDRSKRVTHYQFSCLMS